MARREGVEGDPGPPGSAPVSKRGNRLAAVLAAAFGGLAVVALFPFAAPRLVEVGRLPDTFDRALASADTYNATLERVVPLQRQTAETLRLLDDVEASVKRLNQLAADLHGRIVSIRTGAEGPVADALDRSVDELRGLVASLEVLESRVGALPQPVGEAVGRVAALRATLSRVLADVRTVAADIRRSTITIDRIARDLAGPRG